MSFGVEGAGDAAIAGDGTFWILAGRAIRHLSAEGKELEATVPGLDKPTALSIDPKGRLLVCDDGRRQQVLTFDISAGPG